MAGSYIVNVPKLKGRENYDEWAFAVENFMILEGVDIKKEDGEAATSVDDQKAKAKLVMTIDSSLYVHIKCEKTVHGVWTKLKSLFDDSGFTRRISLLRTLISIRLENCDSMTAYITQLIDTAHKLKGTGFDINEEWVGSLLLAGLPEKFSPMIMAIEHSGIAISADVIKTKLMDMSDNVGSTETESAFLSSKNWQRKKDGKVGKPGDTSTSNRHVKTIKCYKCKQLGHYKNQCPQNKEKQVNAFSAVFLNGSFSKEEWYIDSGASNHMMICQENIKNTSHNLTTKEIIVANKTTMPVLCSGDTQITTVVENTEHDILVKDVLCIPDLTTNLLSVSQLIKHGNKISFQQGHCYIRNRQNELIGIAQLVNGVYRLNTRPACVLAASARTTSDVIWHRRLGHINSTDMNAMKNGAVEGLMYDNKADIGKYNCTVCCEGKQTRLPFPQSSHRSESVLEVVHADVCGPMENKSIGSSRYFLLFVDDYSRMSFVYFLKNKSEVFASFKEFKNMVEKQTNSCIRTLRTDNGTEFCSNEMRAFLKQSGIIHQRTNPYSPEQNGMCERFNRTIVEKARCLLYDAKLEKKFWAEAVHTAVYLKNRSIASGLHQKTPYELWNGRKPNISHIRVFGSTVMSHVPKEKRLKWDKKAEKHYLVGYADNVKGYRLYNPKTNKVITSRDVTIMEPNDNPEMIQAVVKENSSAPANPAEQHEDQTSSDSDESTSTVISKDDSTYVEEEPSTSSSEEFFDTLPLRELEDLNQMTKPKAEVRQRKKPERYGYSNMCVEADFNLYGDQITYEEAINGPESEEWCQAMKEELQSFEDNKAWEVVDKPNNATVVQCKWVFKKKLDKCEKVRYRARLVAKGFTQKAGIDYKETFSPVLRYSTLRLLFALSVKYDLDITHLDVTTAFLNGYLDETVYMKPPENFVCQNRENKVLKLNRAIYGLKQSARAWYKRVDDCLQGLGYKKSLYEPCLFVKQTEKSKTFIALFVDDFFIFSDCKNETECLKTELNSKFKLKDLGEIRLCLGMRVRKENNVLIVDQEQFVEELLRRFNMENCNPVNTPMEVNLKLKKEDICSTKYPYQQLIGSLLYLSLLTRPDISYAVCYLSQFNNCFSESHWKHVKRILKYLKKTKSYALKYVKDDLDLIGYVDADWASDCTDRKSYTGFMFKMSGSVISFECKKQLTIALSSTEAEYMAICEAAKEAIYLKNLLCELKCRNELPVCLYNDNQSAQKLTKNSVFHKRSKHIDVRYHFVRTAVENNSVQINYLNTNDMPADILTKSLCPQKHYKFIEQFGIAEI